jgi:hypothetical protein
LAPDPKHIKVALEKLVAAGNLWDDQAQPLLGASNATTGRIDLTATEMGLAAPIHGAYHDICTGMQKILQQASGQATAIGGALLQSAKTYQTEEDNNTHKINGVW